MIIGKLIGEEDGHTVTRQFSSVAQVEQWAKGAGLADFNDQTARGEAWEGTSLRWVKSGLQNAEVRERERLRYAANALARWGVKSKKGYL